MLSREIFLVICLAICKKLECKRMCTQGEITGLDCPSAASTAKEYEPLILDLKERLQDLHEHCTDRITNIRSLISRSITQSTNSTRHRIGEFKATLDIAKDEANHASLGVQQCIAKCDHEASGLYASFNFVKCTSPKSISMLQEILGSVVKLQHATNTLSLNCQTMNPLHSGITQLKACFTTKIQDIKNHIVQIKLEFQEEEENVVNEALECIMDSTRGTFSRMGEILESVRNCKYENNGYYKLGRKNRLRLASRSIPLK